MVPRDGTSPTLAFSYISYKCTAFHCYKEKITPSNLAILCLSLPFVASLYAKITPFCRGTHGHVQKKIRRLAG